MDAEPSDETLARAARDGSLAAFDTLVRRHQDKIFGFLSQRVPTPTDAEDLAQQTFILAHQRLHQWRTNGRFAPWLYAIARRQALSHHRWRSRRPATENESAAAELPALGNPASHLLHREGRADVWATARAELKELHFTALWMKYHDDLSVRDIAHALGRTETHVKVILHRARRLLAQHLRPDLVPAADDNPTLSPAPPCPASYSCAKL